MNRYFVERPKVPIDWRNRPLLCTGHWGWVFFEASYSPVLLPVLFGLTHFLFHIWCVREISRESPNLARSIACISHRISQSLLTRYARWNVWHLKTLNLKYSNQPPRRALLENLPVKWWWKANGGNRHWCWKFMMFSEKRRWNFHHSRRPRHSWS